MRCFIRSVVGVWLLVLLWCGGIRKASAEPLYLRLPLHGQNIGVVGGFPEISVGGWILDRIGASLEFRLLDNEIGASIGGRVHLLGGERGFQLDLLLGANIRFPVVDPSFGLFVNPSLAANIRLENWLFSLQLALPVGFTFSQPLVFSQLTLIELWAMRRLGPVWLGIQGFIGPRVDVSNGIVMVSPAYQGSLVLLFQFEGQKK